MTVLAWGAKVSPEFRDKVRAIAAHLGTSPSWLMACMAFETGRTFSPWARNPRSSATGLIQFMATTARSLGTTTEALAGMTAEQQLDYVYDYFKPYTGRLGSLGDCYMAILWPPAVGKPDDFEVFADASAAYAANAALDIDHDGAVTKRECVAFVEKLLAEGLEVGNRTFEETQPEAPIEDRTYTDLPQAPSTEKSMPEESPNIDWSGMLKVGGAIASFFNPLIGVAISSLGPLLEQKIEKTVGKHTDPVTAKAVAGQLSAAIEDSLAKVTGKTDPVAAVAEIRANPTAAAAVSAAVEQKLVDMTPLLNEMHRQAQERYAAEAQDRNDAAGRVAKVGWNIQQYLVIGGLVITGIIVIALLAVMIVQVATAPNHLPDATLIAFAGPLLVIAMRGLADAYAFAFGGTQEGSPAAIAKGTSK